MKCRRRDTTQACGLAASGLGRIDIRGACGSNGPMPGEDEHWMREAVAAARQALEVDEVPVGCVVVHKGRLVGRAHNQRELLQDPTAHAEMIAITQAAEAVGSWRLHGCTMYVTLEPCAMCAGAMVLARLDRLVYGATDPKAGAVVSVFRLLDEPRLNHRVAVAGGILAAECGAVLSEFFRRKRAAAGGDSDTADADL
jgi:tRNA(adenine34) deaminase